MRTVIFAMAVAGGLGAAGCSVLMSVDDLTAGERPRDAQAAEAAGPNASDGGGDGRANESGTFDVTPAIEAGYVDANVVLSDNFERDAITGNWASPFDNAGGTIGITLSTSMSATRSAWVHLSTAADTRAGLGSQDYPNVDHVRVSFAMKTAQPDRPVALFRVRLRIQNGNDVVFDLYLQNNQLVAQEQVFVGTSPGGDVTYPLSGFTPDVWQRWTMELDARSSPAIGVVTVDSAEILRKPLTNAFARGALGVILGTVYAPAGPARDIWYDDVSIAVLP